MVTRQPTVALKERDWIIAMRMTRLLAPTLRENPADAEVASHQLLVRAGYIRRLTSGVYNYLPLMWRVLKKVEQIVREEMDAAGAQELLMPIMQPCDIWQESCRWDVYGKELIRFQDRHERWNVLGPTHEEVITTIAKHELRSYKKLPVNLYQIQNKYRDEIRPRFGLLRGREFIMKDAYSFHSREECLQKEYDNMAETYYRIFKRCGLDTRMVRSDSGAIGGNVSHEFMVLTRPLPGEMESGENDVFFCNGCGYAANANRAESKLKPANTTGEYTSVQDVDTPNATAIEILDKEFGIRPEIILKSLLYIADESNPVLALVRGDIEIEEVKLQNAIGANELRMATEEEVKRYTNGSSKGFVGPVDLPESVMVIGDHSVSELKNFAVAYNVPHKHRLGVNWDTDVPQPKTWADIRLVRAGEGCVECGHPSLQVTSGIEVGNIFQLGSKYSEAMKAIFVDEDGTEKPFLMGCYGIGVSRVAAAAVEQFHDQNGIIWPPAIAPYQMVVVPVNVTNEDQMKLAESLYQQLSDKGIEVILDDRDERAGVKFKDADLMGIPVRITIGKKFAEGQLELKRRDESGSRDVAVDAVVDEAIELLTSWNPLDTAMAPSNEPVASKS